MTAHHSSTTRPPVDLPRMPSEQELSADCPPIPLQRCRLSGEELLFDCPDGFDRALAQGFFLIEVPDGTDPAPGDRFASHFHEDRAGDALDGYRGYRDIEVPGPYQGYFDREHDQWENFYVEKTNWGLLPAEVATLGEQMTGMGIAVLRAVFRHLAIPPGLWSRISNGLTDNGGHQMLAFNHFRSAKPARGAKFHRDSGWVTVLRSVEPGLLALVEGRLGAIDPRPGHFIVNFGSSLEVLTERLPRPVRANVHGVVSTRRAPGRPDRFSYVTFLDSALDGSVYRFEDGEPRRVQSVADFATQEVERTYDDTSAL
ncbi:2OG-Fe(II) oxygenase family protein [Streptomyces morookaense]|uniref:2OG-Fe(II) oxygenase family protein n=1 Tax=Streptomyces morookaense TaxID=1970 RepID=UPI0033FBEB28